MDAERRRPESAPEQQVGLSAASDCDRSPQSTHACWWLGQLPPPVYARRRCRLATLPPQMAPSEAAPARKKRSRSGRRHPGQPAEQRKRAQAQTGGNRAPEHSSGFARRQQRSRQATPTTSEEAAAAGEDAARVMLELEARGSGSEEEDQQAPACESPAASEADAAAAAAALLPSPAVAAKQRRAAQRDGAAAGAGRRAACPAPSSSGSDSEDGSGEGEQAFGIVASGGWTGSAPLARVWVSFKRQHPAESRQPTPNSAVLHPPLLPCRPPL